MIMYEHDPDVHWGLQFLHGDLFSDFGYCEHPNHNNSNYYDREYSREMNHDPVHPSLDNDEIFARALQEEFSQLAVVESEENYQQALTSQQWYGSPEGNTSSGNIDQSSSCSSIEENVYHEEEWFPVPDDDFCVLDGEVGKRLNQMVPMPHVPRINGEIPSVDEATSDHQRLLQRLQLYELVECKVPGDGNCQFRAISDQFYRTPEHHKFVRLQVTNQLRAHPEFYEGYVPMNYGEYMKKMSRTSEWGDHVTLQAAADTYGVKIFVITSFRDTCYIEILPAVQKSKRVIFLSFWAEVHYNSIYSKGEMPASETTKKRRWWHFGSRH